MDNSILIQIYLDWVNNYITIERFAEIHNITVGECEELLRICKLAHERAVSSVSL